jgi:tRNA pseudouridine38-40 synthase
VDIAYDGTGFHGYAPNEGVETVGGTLERVLGDLCGVPVSLTCAGRTDAGVHAVGQVLHCDVPADRVDEIRWRRAIRSRSGGRITARAVRVVDPSFDARFSATWRRYQYLLDLGEEPSPLWRNRAWWVGPDLDVVALEHAATLFVGSHDFAAFCRRPKRADGTTASLVRNVLESRIVDVAPWGAGSSVPSATFEIRANAFCHQMVRSIVGTLVAVGEQRLTADDVADLLVAPDRTLAPNPAPPHGLVLWEVGYD